MWPKQSECDAFYGNPRSKTHPAEPSTNWEIANLTRVLPPFRVYYDRKPVASIKIHKLCAESLERVLAAIWQNARQDQAMIDAWGVSIYAGSYNFRPMRGLSALSMHSYACAIDLDPARNSLGDITPRFANFRPQVIQPFLDEGWLWGGDWDGDGSSSDERRCDGMHFQAARLG